MPQLRLNQRVHSYLKWLISLGLRTTGNSTRIQEFNWGKSALHYNGDLKYLVKGIEFCNQLKWNTLKELQKEIRIQVSWSGVVWFMRPFILMSFKYSALLNWRAQQHCSSRRVFCNKCLTDCLGLQCFRAYDTSGKLFVLLF